MADSALHSDRFLTAPEFFSRAQERFAFDVPVGLADPNVLPQHDAHDTGLTNQQLGRLAQDFAGCKEEDA